MDMTQMESSVVMVGPYAVVTGTQNDDFLHPPKARGFIDGLGGADTVNYSPYADPLMITPSSVGDLVVNVNDQQKDLLRNIERVIGGSADDRMTGTSANEVFFGGPGRDILDGGAGFDGAEYSDKDKSVEVDLSVKGPVVVKVGGQHEDTLHNIEAVIGGLAGDTLKAAAGRSMLAGGKGDDTLIANGGDDILMGGKGADTFVFKSVSDSPFNDPSRIIDFNSDDGDRIDLSAIDAHAAQDGFQALAFSGQNSAAHSVWYSVGADYGDWYAPPAIRVDVTGDAVEDMMILVETGSDVPFHITAAALGLVAE